MELTPAIALAETRLLRPEVLGGSVEVVRAGLPRPVVPAGTRHHPHGVRAAGPTQLRYITARMR